MFAFDIVMSSQKSFATSVGYINNIFRCISHMITAVNYLVLYPMEVNPKHHWVICGDKIAIPTLSHSCHWDHCLWSQPLGLRMPLGSSSSLTRDWPCHEATWNSWIEWHNWRHDSKPLMHRDTSFHLLFRSRVHRLSALSHLCFQWCMLGSHVPSSFACLHPSSMEESIHASASVHRMIFWGTELYWGLHHNWTN